MVADFLIGAGQCSSESRSMRERSRIFGVRNLKTVQVSRRAIVRCTIGRFRRGIAPDSAVVRAIRDDAWDARRSSCGEVYATPWAYIKVAKNGGVTLRFELCFFEPTFPM